MRIAGLLVIAGCGATSSLSVAPGPARAHPCDSAHWSELARGRLRAWPQSATAPAHVVEVAGTRVEVASVTHGVIVTRWVAHASLASIASVSTPVWPARGGKPDRHVRILIGHRLGPPAGGWAAVHELDGFVPESLVATSWSVEENAPDTTRDRRFLRRATGDVRTGADDAAPVRHAMHRPTTIQIRAGAGNGYVAVTVLLPLAEIDGFWKPPPPEVLTPEEEARAESSVELPAIQSPIAVGTCLHDAPNGRVVGMIRGVEAFARPTPSAVAGWYAATIPTIWGPSTYYIDTPPVEPSPVDEWRWTESWGNEW